MPDPSLKLNSGFTIGRYQFTLFGGSADEIVYKVFPIDYNPDVTRFYDEIMNNHETDNLLGLIVGYVIITKKAFIDIDQIDNTYYMLLNLKIATFSNYSSTIHTSPMECIYQNFSPVIIGQCKYAMDITIHRVNNGNSFANKYFASINISTIDNIRRIISYLHRDVFTKVEKIINDIINIESLFKIGFECHYIVINAIDAVQIVGYLIPYSVNNVHVKSITMDSIDIIFSDKWVSQKVDGVNFDVRALIPYVYNTEKLFFSPTDMQVEYYEDPLDQETYCQLSFKTKVFSINTSDENTLSDNKNIVYRHYKFFHIENGFIIYKQDNAPTLYKYFGIVMLEDREKFISYLNNNKRLFGIGGDLEFTYFDNVKAYFVITPTFKFRHIYDYIVTKLRLKLGKRYDI